MNVAHQGGMSATMTPSHHRKGKCPLWVISGHSSVHKPMSALPLKADMFSVRINVC